MNELFSRLYRPQIRSADTGGVAIEGEIVGGGRTMTASRRTQALFLLLSLLAGPAFGVSLTGTWVKQPEGPMYCRGMTYRHFASSLDLPSIRITHVPETVLDSGELYISAAFSDPVKFRGYVQAFESNPARGEALAVSCNEVGDGGGGPNAAGLMRFKVRPTGQGHKIVAQFFIRWYTDALFECRAAFLKSSNANPNITPCP